MSRTAETTDYDPRYDRAQTIEGAKARYVESDDYSLANFESDVERILNEGENPDTDLPWSLTKPEMGYI